MTHVLSRTLSATPGARSRSWNALAAWLVPAGLVLLSLVPSAMGVVRLAGFVLGRATLPDHARLAMYAPLVAVHAATAMVFALLGALQFSAPLRRRAFHGLAGRVLVPAGALAAVTGIWLAISMPEPAEHIPLLRTFRVLAGLATLTCLAEGLLALSHRDYAAHGAWLTRAYALFAAAGTQVFTLLPYMTLAQQKSPGVSSALLLSGWVINLAVAEIVIRRRRASRSRAGSEPNARSRGASIAPVALVALVALAALTPSSAHADDSGEGVRAAHLLDAAAESARDRRVVDGVAALATGTTAVGVGVALWITPSDSSTRTVRDVFGGVFVGVGSVLALVGGVSLIAPSSLERLRAIHGPALRAGGPDADVAARAVGAALGARASAARIERRASAISTFVLGIAMAVWGVALEVEATDHGRVVLGRSLLVASAGSVAIGVGELVVRSEEERFFDLYRKLSPPPPKTAASALRLTPRIGLGTVGLAGTF